MRSSLCGALRRKAPRDKLNDSKPRPTGCVVPLCVSKEGGGCRHIFICIFLNTSGEVHQKLLALVAGGEGNLPWGQE